MELKKKPEADVNRMKPLFFQLGLAAAIGLVLMAFEWQTREVDAVAFEASAGEAIEMIEPPITEQPPPERPKPIIAPVVKEVPDDKIIEEIPEIILDDLSEDFEVTLEPEPIPEEKVPKGPLTIAEVMPTPKGGMQAFYKFVRNNMKYPRSAVRAGAEGRVFVQFTVETDGSLTDFNILKGVGFGCDEEAIRVLGEFPNWKPGKQRGNPVRVRMVMPITFRLQ